MNRSFNYKATSQQHIHTDTTQTKLKNTHDQKAVCCQKTQPWQITIVIWKSLWSSIFYITKKNSNYHENLPHWHSLLEFWKYVFWTIQKENIPVNLRLILRNSGNMLPVGKTRRKPVSETRSWVIATPSKDCLFTSVSWWQENQFLKLTFHLPVWHASSLRVLLLLTNDIRKTSWNIIHH